jgi:hypothetical protein
MDDAQIRQALDWPADNPEPPSAVSLEEATTAGRRRIRWRRLVAVGSVLAVSAAMAIAFSVIGSPGSSGQNGRIRHSLPTAPGRTPHAFNPLVPYASFGWLPPGARATAFLLTRTLVSVETGPGRTQISLAVEAPGRCRLSGPVRYRFRDQFLQAPRSLACLAQRRPRVVSRLPLTGVAAAVHGRRAWWSYWQADPGEMGLKPTLIWQFTPGGWAVVSVGVPEGGPRGPLSSSVRTELHKLADHVRFGSGEPFRYAFRLTHVPAGWAVLDNQVDYLAPGKKSLEITIGPARLSTDFVTQPIPGPQVDLSEAVPWTMCSALSKTMRQVKLGHGVSGTMMSFPGGANRLNQSLCIRHVYGIGLGIELSSGNSPAAAAGYPGVIAVYRDLQFPSGGTTSPMG